MNIVESIYNEPHKWKPQGHSFKHENGVKIWTSNGLHFINLHPAEVYMPFTMKVRIWLAIRWWIKNIDVNNIGSSYE